MREDILKRYFDGTATAKALDKDIEGSETKTGHDLFTIKIDQINNIDKFEVSSKNLLRLCDDSIKGILKFKHLTTIGRALEFSEYFTWNNDTTDGRIVGTVVFDWANPEINFPLNMQNMMLWKEYLETGVYSLKIYS